MRHSENGSRAGTMDYGMLFGVAAIILMFELVPGASVGRLSTRTVSEEMRGFDPGELYEVPPEMPEEDPVDVESIISSEIPEVVQPDQVISLDPDAQGLDTVATVDPNVLEPGVPEDERIPEPGTFVPHSVHPVCTYRPTPDYPEMARQAGVEGRVTLQVFVSAEGVPLEVVVVQSSGLASMDEAAKESIMRSSWSPAKRDDGVAVGVWTSVIYDFVLD
ncbi:MAG: hypothetical protein AVO35_07700 [Candidatus Aegiribacteria sp. MLS_C]|nr:MAG: hypothetical protein AVO35_07700 [Candidatus Aegiribacteria sp. MLS_C]